MIPVVLSGGSGTRLWPLSRKAKPKQFLALTDDATMLQNTITRVASFPGAKAPMVVCNESHRFMVAEQLREIDTSHSGIILEPVARDTAPAIALAALHALNTLGDENILILPSDHVIEDVAAFHQAITKAETLAEQGYLVTFGIVPTKPETGYGYIQAGIELAEEAGSFRVDAFVEKPDESTAQAYLSSGNYFWNGGMFLFRASRLITELERTAPAVLQQCREALNNSAKDFDFIRIEEKAFSLSPSISFDYAVMEKTDSAAVVPFDAGWNDVGAYSALWEALPKDQNNNASKGDVLIDDCINSLVISESRLVSTLGLKDVVVIETHDAVMVASKEKAQNIKATVDALKAQKRTEATEHRQGFRPWGMYDCIDKGSRFQVKRITVNPGGKLSLQMHHHRAEHWIVVSGTAKIRCGDVTKLLSENESTYIPLGELHQLSNPGRVPLELIEVQSGSYLGEDDIERFEDIYGRTAPAISVC